MGIIITNYDIEPPFTHNLIVKVKDAITNKAIENADIDIEKGYVATDTHKQTNRKGISKLKRIFGYEEFTITVSANGYQKQILNVDANQFFKKREKVYINLLPKIDANVVTTNAAINTGYVWELPAKNVAVEPAIVKAIAIKPTVMSKPSELKMYPNPAPKNSLVFIAIKDADANAIHIVNTEGIVIQKIDIIHENKNNQISFRMADNMLTGVYVVEITNSKGMLLSAGKLIVE
jgi:Secretion system C-terminal sorting domain